MLFAITTAGTDQSFTLAFLMGGTYNITMERGRAVQYRDFHSSLSDGRDLQLGSMCMRV